MAFDMIREPLDIERYIGEGSAQALVEGNVLIPGSGRENAQILFADGTIQIGGVEVQSDRVAMDGNVTFTVLYTQGEEARVRTMTASCAFNHAMDIPGVTPHMIGEVMGTLEHVEAECVGGRCTLRAVAALKTRVNEAVQVACIRKISGLQALEVRTTTINHLHKLGRAHGRQLVREEFSLPTAIPALEALHGKATARLNSTSVQDGRIVMSGEIWIDAICSTETDGRPITRVRQSMPFEQIMELEAAQPGLEAIGQADVEDVTVEVLFTQEDQRALRAEMVLTCYADVYEQRSDEAIMDAYCASAADVQLRTETVPVCTRVQTVEGSDSLKANLTIPSELPPVSTVLSVLVRPVVSTRYAMEGRTYVEGIFDTSIIYMATGRAAPVSIAEEVPFRAAYPFEIADSEWLDVMVEDAEIIPITGDRLELKCVMYAYGIAGDTRQAQLAVDAELLETTTLPDNGITVYFTQPKDSLWSIAKQYRTTQETLRRLNPGLEEVKPGERVILYRKPASFV